MHEFDEPTQINIFLGGMSTKLMLDASTEGMIKSKTLEETNTLIENTTSNEFKVQNERIQGQKRDVLELKTQDALLAQNKLTTQQMEALMKKLSTLP